MSYQLWAVVALLGYTGYQLVLKKLGYLPPQVTVALILTVVALSAWASIFLGDTKGLLGKIDRDTWKWVLLGASLLFLADYSFTRTYTMPRASSAVITIIVSALPVTTALLFLFVEKKTVTPVGWLGMAITLSGIALVVKSES